MKIDRAMRRDNKLGKRKRKIKDGNDYISKKKEKQRAKRLNRERKNKERFLEDLTNPKE